MMERTWLLIFASLGVNAIFLILLADRLGWPTFEQWVLNPATAAWIQAIGSIAAIAAAAWVVNRQHLLAERQRVVDRIEAQVGLINGALLILFSQFNVLLTYRDQILQEQRANPFRHFALPATHTLDYPHWIVDWQKLAFLFEIGAKEQLLECMLAHNAFHSAAKSVNERVQVHRGEYQMRMEHSGIDFNGDVLIFDVAKAAGPRISQTLKAATDDLYDQVDFAIEHLTQAGNNAAMQLRVLFKGHQIMRFVPPNSTA